MTFKKIVPLAFTLMLFIIGMMFMVVTLSAVDSGVNMTGSAYEDQYSSITTTSQASMTILEPVGIFLAIIVLMVAAVGIHRAVK